MSPNGQYWYEVVDDDSLRQGDIFRDFPAVWFTDDLPALDDLVAESAEAGEAAPANAPVEYDIGNWIILTASCDLDTPRVAHALIARIEPATNETLRAQSAKERNTTLEALRRGFVPDKFLLAPCTDIEPDFPLSVVFFRQHVLVPKAYLRRHTSDPRLRLKPPWREKFGVWVGSRFMDVGVEDEMHMDWFTERLYPPHVLDSNDRMDQGGGDDTGTD